MQQGGCETIGKWTPSDQDIYGNEQADIWAKKATLMTKCHDAEATLGWGKAYIRRLLME